MSHLSYSVTFKIHGSGDVEMERAEGCFSSFKIDKNCEDRGEQKYLWFHVNCTWGESEVYLSSVFYVKLKFQSNTKVMHLIFTFISSFYNLMFLYLFVVYSIHYIDGINRITESESEIQRSRWGLTTHTASTESPLLPLFLVELLNDNNCKYFWNSYFYDLLYFFHPSLNVYLSILLHCFIQVNSAKEWEELFLSTLDSAISPVLRRGGSLYLSPLCHLLIWIVLRCLSFIAPDHLLDSCLIPYLNLGPEYIYLLFLFYSSPADGTWEFTPNSLTPEIKRQYP